MPKVCSDKSFFNGKVVRRCKEEILEVAREIDMSDSGLAMRLRDSEDGFEIMAFHTILFAPPHLKDNIINQEGSKPLPFELGSRDSDHQRTLFCSSYPSRDGKVRDFIYKGQLIHRPIYKLSPGDVLSNGWKDEYNPQGHKDRFK